MYILCHEKNTEFLGSGCKTLDLTFPVEIFEGVQCIFITGVDDAFKGLELKHSKFGNRRAQINVSIANGELRPRVARQHGGSHQDVHHFWVVERFSAGQILIQQDVPR